MFEDVVEYLARVEDPHENPHERRRFSQDAIERIRRRHRGIPEEYLTYLMEVGAGAVCGRRFGVYRDLMEPSYPLCDEDFRLDGSIVCFGYKPSGDQAGFWLSDWRVVEIDHADLSLTFIEESFATYIRWQIFGGEEG